MNGMLSELGAEREAHLGVVNGRWRLIGIVQPREQITVYEQLLPQQGDEIGQAPTERAPQLKELHHQHRYQRGPDLRPDRILAGADKGLDPQSLFDRLKKQLSGKGLARCSDVRPVSNPSP